DVVSRAGSRYFWRWENDPSVFDRIGPKCTTTTPMRFATRRPRWIGPATAVFPFVRQSCSHIRLELWPASCTQGRPASGIEAHTGPTEYPPPETPLNHRSSCEVSLCRLRQRS